MSRHVEELTRKSEELAAAVVEQGLQEEVLRREEERGHQTCRGVLLQSSAVSKLIMLMGIRGGRR